MLENIINGTYDLFFVILQLSEYIRAHDYMNGFIVIVDITEVKLVDILPKINLMYLRQALSIYIVSIIYILNLYL